MSFRDLFFPPKYTGPERRKKRRWRPRPLRLVATLLVFAAAVYAVAVIWAIRREARLVLQAGSTLATGRPLFPYDQIDIPRTDGVRQFAWVVRPAASDAGPWVLYLHGNISSLASQVNIAHYDLLRRLGINVLAPEYRGFGGIPGPPTEQTLRDDARAALDYLRDVRRVPEQAVVVYGWSLGTAIGVDLATRTPPAAMILEGAPTSLLDLTTRRYPLFPMRLLVRTSFDSFRTIGDISAPMLFLHATNDEVIPLSDGRQLFEAARGPKTFVELQGGHVSAIEVDAAGFEAALRAFLRQYLPSPAR